MKKDLIEILYENKKIVIIIGFILIASISLSFILSAKIKRNTPKKEDVTTELKLFGPRTITLQTGEDFEEPGYYAIASNGKIRSDEVTIKTNFDKNIPGTYTVTYQIDDKILTRMIEVTGESISDTENPIVDSKKIALILKGEKVITLSKGEEYIEPGYSATLDGKELTNQVTTTGIVDTNTPGEYTLTYTIEYNGERETVIRTIIILDDTLTISIIPNTTSYTNSHVTFNVKVEGNNYQTLVFPNNVISEEKETTYDVTTNGTYTFTAYNINGKSFSKTVTVTNIDNQSPTGSCLATINQTSTNININAFDDLSGIANYIYYDNGTELIRSLNSFYNHNQKTSKNVYIMVYDKAGNSSRINCNVTDNSALNPIKPNSDESIIRQSETNTLKVYISKKSGYYITRVWAYNPYQQLNKFDSPEYGSNLYYPKTLLEKAKAKYNLDNQLLVGFNASGFYLANTYDAYSVSKYAKYNKTSVGTLVITNGKVIRNVYDKAYKTWYTIGVDKTNTLRIFQDKKASSSKEIEEKKQWAQSVINSGIRNTFTFASPLIENGQKSNDTTSMPSINERENRQAICQVNSNNFVLITGSNLNRTSLQNIMLDLKCQTGINLDGGGSIALVYQERGTNTISTIIGNGRKLTEVGYFSE